MKTLRVVLIAPLILALALPPPAFALRQLNAGMEESPVQEELRAQLSIAAGAEEGHGWRAGLEDNRWKDDAWFRQYIAGVEGKPPTGEAYREWLADFSDEAVIEEAKEALRTIHQREDQMARRFIVGQDEIQLRQVSQIVDAAKQDKRLSAKDRLVVLEFLAQTFLVRSNPAAGAEEQVADFVLPPGADREVWDGPESWTRMQPLLDAPDSLRGVVVLDQVGVSPAVAAELESQGAVVTDLLTAEELQQAFPPSSMALSYVALTTPATAERFEMSRGRVAVVIGVDPDASFLQNVDEVSQLAALIQTALRASTPVAWEPRVSVRALLVTYNGQQLLLISA